MKYLKIFEADDIVYPVQPVIPGYLVNKYYYCPNENIPILTSFDTELCPGCKHELKKLTENQFFQILKEKSATTSDFEEIYHMIKYGMVDINSLPVKKPEYKVNPDVKSELSNDNPDDNYGYNEPN